MNSQKYKIQALIAEIDEVLSKPATRLPWAGSIDNVHLSRHLLERVRAYLVSQDSKLPAGQKPASSQNRRPEQVRVPPPPPPLPAAGRPLAAEQILLAVTGEIDRLRENLTQPLQEDIQALREEQQALVQEIKQLEAVRQQQQSLAQQQANQQQIISQFMQALTDKLQKTLTGGASQTLGNLENQFLAGSAAPDEGATSDSGLDLSQQRAGEYPVLTPAQRLEQMQQFQARADSLLMRLDSTMETAFEALQGNLQSYQESLSQGLDRMHGLGQQSEAMFAAWVNHLAQQLGRETYAWAQRPIDLANRESATAAQPIEPADADPALPNTARSHPAAAPSIPEQVQEDRSSGVLGEEDRLPYAGTEISRHSAELRRDGDRAPTPSSLPELEEKLFGSQPLSPTAAAFPEAQTETAPPGGSENAEDLYASLFATEEIAELELEPFVLENTETETEIAPLPSQTPETPSTAEPLAAEDLFANLLAQDESLEDFLVGEDSELATANSVEELTLDTENLFPAQLAAEPLVSEPLAPTDELQIDAGDREPAETVSNSGELSDTPAAVPPSRPRPPVLRTAPEISSTLEGAQPRVPSARDVQTGDFYSESLQPEEAYIQASPDENLLPVEESEDLEDRALTLDNNTLQQLEADLYGLEGLENSVSRRPSALAEDPDGRAENPPAAAAEEEVGTLEDLFADVLEMSPLDEPFSLEEELDAELFAEAEDPNLTLDEILASLTQAQTTEIDALNPERSTAGETEGLLSALPDGQKKN